MNAQKKTTRQKSTAYQRVNRVEVFLWGKQVGAVALDPVYGYYAFAYAPAFVKAGIEPAPLQMPLNNGDPYLFTDLPVETYKRSPGLHGQPGHGRTYIQTKPGPFEAGGHLN